MDNKIKNIVILDNLPDLKRETIKRDSRPSIDDIF